MLGECCCSVGAVLVEECMCEMEVQLWACSDTGRA